MPTSRFGSAFLSLILLAVIVAVVSVTTRAQAPAKMLVAHRGASAYAPEHTVTAYTLAMTQGADYVEQDLQITKDGQLVCIHDLTLERTTNAKDVFPGRSRTVVREGREVQEWPVSDFTLAEIKQLDSGSWFDPKFKDQRILTFQEAIDLMKGKAGIYPETKAPEVYGSIGFDMEKLVIDVLVRNGLDKPGAVAKTPVVIQSFSAESLQKMRKELGVKLTLVFLMGGPSAERWLTKEGLAEVKTFADGIGPDKSIISRNPEVVTRAHQAGLTVTPYTFRSKGQPEGRNVRDEMHDFLYTFGVDALFTDNPDLFPRK